MCDACLGSLRLCLLVTNAGACHYGLITTICNQDSIDEALRSRWIPVHNTAPRSGACRAASLL